MIEPRVYWPAFVPALLAVVLVMFSLESRPGPLDQGLAADILFDGSSAAQTARDLVSAAPDRRAGTLGDRETARTVRAALTERGFSVETDRFDVDGATLVNVVGRRAGRSRRQVVVLAARDAPGIPDAGGTAADTAALLELARVFEGRPSRKTLVFASVDGSALGEVGTERIADDLIENGEVDGIIVLSGFGLPRGSQPALVAWSNDTSRAGIGLVRTTAASLREEIGPPAEGASPAGQIARLAFPIGIGAQGVLLERGLDAVRIAGDGEVPDGGGSTAEEIDGDRLGALGRSALRTMTALEEGPTPRRGPDTYLTVVSQVMPGSVLALLAATLIFPALVASVDALARARRRRAAVLPWLILIAAGALPFALALGLARVLALTGATPDPPAASVAPGIYPLDAAGGAALGAVLATIALGWFGLRYLAVRADPQLADRSAPGAGVAVALTLTAAAITLWLVDPFAALLLVPGLHLWILATLTDPVPPPRARVAMVALGALLPALVFVYYLFALDLDPLSGAWYLFLLVIGGQVSTITVLIWCALAASFGTVLSLARVDRPVGPGGEQPSVRGPAGYAGPGALGAVDSGFRR